MQSVLCKKLQTPLTHIAQACLVTRLAEHESGIVGTEWNGQISVHCLG